MSCKIQSLPEVCTTKAVRVTYLPHAFWLIHVEPQELSNATKV